MNDKPRLYNYQCRKCDATCGLQRLRQPVASPACNRCGVPMECTNPDDADGERTGLGKARAGGVTDKELMEMRKAELREYVAILEGVCNAAEVTLARQSQTMKEQADHVDALTEELDNVREYGRQQTELAAQNLKLRNGYAAELLKLRLAVSNMILDVWAD